MGGDRSLIYVVRNVSSQGNDIPKTGEPVIELFLTGLCVLEEGPRDKDGGEMEEEDN